MNTAKGILDLLIGSLAVDLGHPNIEKKERANEVLRYAISVLDGTSGMVCTTKGTFEVALALKRDLARLGAWWQVKRLENHIHKWQGKHRRDSL